MPWLVQICTGLTVEAVMAAHEEVTPEAPCIASQADQEARRNARRRELGKMTKARLISMCRRGVTKPDGTCYYIEGGMYPLDKWSKADIIASIMSAEFPPGAVSSFLRTAQHP